MQTIQMTRIQNIQIQKGEASKHVESLADTLKLRKVFHFSQFSPGSMPRTPLNMTRFTRRVPPFLYKNTPPLQKILAMGLGKTPTRGVHCATPKTRRIRDSVYMHEHCTERLCCYRPSNWSALPSLSFGGKPLRKAYFKPLGVY
jgi:hypothetical protein